MGKRGKAPSENPGQSIGTHVDAETVAHLDDVVHTRKRSRSFIAAEAIKRGLPLVERDFPALRKSRRKVARARTDIAPARQTGAKKSEKATAKKRAARVAK